MRLLSPVRKIKKLATKPHIFLRDALLNKYPLILNKNGVSNGSEDEIIKSIQRVNLSFIPEFEIDIVYTWVDSKDKDWINKKDNFISNERQHELYATEDSRFQSHNEIYYSLLSISKNMPWVRKIYIVTDEQSPLVPDIIKNKVTLIDHREIIPCNFLPTFNSHVIEAYLHNIKGLSENFIYFNDDFFAARPLESSHFFKSNGLASLFISNCSIREMKANGRPTATLLACTNCNVLFNDKFQTTFDNTLTHTYVPLKKSHYEKAHQLFEKEILSFSTNKFRSNNDLNVATFLVPYLQYSLQKSTPALDICTYFNIRSPSAKTFYRELLNAKKNHKLPHSFCANDFSSKEFDDNDYQHSLTTFLQSFFNDFPHQEN
ncbi:stealth family protein [Pantoea sp. SM3]|uniref:stealth family protein n=1 Tax=Pantoea sp. SM3 TaxID=1628192 RepID=UPI0006988727|nr:stealth family protein [Pantoea sp. SM3]